MYHISWNKHPSPMVPTLQATIPNKRPLLPHFFKQQGYNKNLLPLHLQLFQLQLQGNQDRRVLPFQHQLQGNWGRRIPSFPNKSVPVISTSMCSQSSFMCIICYFNFYYILPPQLSAFLLAEFLNNNLGVYSRKYGVYIVYAPGLSK